MSPKLLGWLAAPLVAGAGLIPLALLPGPTASAIVWPDGTVGFTYPPRLIDSYATRNLIGQRPVTYYYTISFPAEAEAPLAKIVISMDEGWDNIFRYDLGSTQAFLETPTGRLPVPLGEVSQEQGGQTVLTINFDPPVNPGMPLILALRPWQNPRFGGVYLFGATAYPAGEVVKPTFMGYARLSFYEPDGGGVWP